MPCHLAGAGAYYVAKREINAERASKYQELQKRKLEQERLEYSSHSTLPTSPPQADTNTAAGEDTVKDPATGRPPGVSPYAGSEPYKNRKGDRFA